MIVELPNPYHYCGHCGGRRMIVREGARYPETCPTCGRSGKARDHEQHDPIYKLEIVGHDPQPI